jgi:hypothetical protein
VKTSATKFATIGVYRPSTATFYLRNTNTPGESDMIIPFGAAGDIPVVGDRDGDGKTTIGVYRPSEATFYLRNSNSPGNPDLTVAFGEQGDSPVTGDWNGNGSTTVGAYRGTATTFFLRNTQTPGPADWTLFFWCSWGYSYCPAGCEGIEKMNFYGPYSD